MIQRAAYLFGLGLILTTLLTPLAMRLGRRWGVLDYPGSRKIHTEPIPLTGGWSIFAALSLILWGNFAVALLLRATDHVADLPVFLQEYTRTSPQLALKVLPLWFGALCIFILGLIDDVRGMSVRMRLVYQFAIALSLVSMGLRPSIHGVPEWAAAVIGVFWIVGITNAYNLLDGLDGLTTGVALVGTSALLAIMVIQDRPIVGGYLAALAGIQLGFLRYNFNPARIFLGSAGALLLGYLMAVSTLLLTFMPPTDHNWLMPLLAPLLLMAIPIYDTASVVVIRFLQKRSIAEGDQSHFHHRLRRLGFSHRQAVLFIWLIAFSASLSAVGLIGASLRRSLLMFVQSLGILCLVIIAERVALNLRRKLLERPSRSRRHSDLVQEPVASESER